MASCNAPQDIIAEQVRQLLVLGEGGQRAQLASLSKYAATKNAAKEYSPNGGASRPNGNRVRPGVASSASVSTYGGSNGGSGQEPSSDSPESSGSEETRKGKVTDGAGTLDQTLRADEPAFVPGFSLGTQGEGGTTQQLQELQHSTDLLKAALANWEACLLTEEACTNAQPSKKGQQAQAAEQAMPAKISTQSLKSAAPSPSSSLTGASSATEVNSDAFALNALQKALSQLTSDLAGNTEQILQQEGQWQHQQQMACKAQEKENLQAVTWLRQHLEKQQEESMMKIVNMLQNEQQRQVQRQSGLDAMASVFTPGAAQAYGGMWPPMVNPALPFAGQPMFPPLAPTGPMPTPFAMPSMVMEHGMGTMPWAPQMAMPGVSGQMNTHPLSTHPSRPFMSQPVQQQAPKQCYGSGGASDVPPGAHGNTLRKNRPALPAGIKEETLRTHLQELQKVEPDKVLLVRKINRLGFTSPATLKAHYSKYGKVERVLVAHSHVNSQNRHFAPRLRPSGLGFVVMSKKEEADAILAEGPEQTVAGGPGHASVAIRVQRFQRRSEDAKDADLNFDDEEQNDQEDGNEAEAWAC